MPTNRISRFAAILRRQPIAFSRLALVAGAIAAAPVLSSPPSRAAEPADASNVVIRIDDRALRTAGISSVPVQREREGTVITLPGSVVIPQQQVRVVAATAGGLVESMLIAADESTKAGQPIARLRSPDVVEAQRQFLSALADEALAEDRLRRSQLLFEGRALPERELRVAQSEAAVAKLRLDERTQILLLMGMTEQDVETLRTTRRIISTLTVVSPIDGTIVTRHASTGEQIKVASPLFTIAELEPLWVNIQVPAARLATIPPGASVNIPAYGAQGRIIRLGRSVDSATQSAIAVAEIDSAHGKVRPGLAVTVAIRLDQSADTAPQWFVPGPAVVRHRDRSWVFIRVPEGFRAHPVQVVSESARGASIRGALSDGDQVAIRGVLSLLSELAQNSKD